MLRNSASHNGWDWTCKCGASWAIHREDSLQAGPGALWCARCGSTETLVAMPKPRFVISVTLPASWDANGAPV